GYISIPAWLIVTLGVAAVAGVGLLIVTFVPRLNRRPLLQFVAAGVIIGALLVTPGFWSMQTTLATNNSSLPTAYTGSTARGGFGGGGARMDDGNRTLPTDAATNRDGMMGGMGGGLSDAMLTYLDENTQGQRYMVAVASSQEGDAAVLKLGRGILFMGGFAG